MDPLTMSLEPVSMVWEPVSMVTLAGPGQVIGPRMLLSPGTM